METGDYYHLSRCVTLSGERRPFGGLCQVIFITSLVFVFVFPLAAPTFLVGAARSFAAACSMPSILLGTYCSTSLVHFFGVMGLVCEDVGWVFLASLETLIWGRGLALLSSMGGIGLFGDR